MRADKNYQKIYSKLRYRRKESYSREVAARQVASKFYNNEFNPRCEKCGVSGAVRLKGCWKRALVGLQIAHLNQNPLDNSLKNIAVLCKPCHVEFDSGKRRKSRKVDKHIKDLIQ